MVTHETLEAIDEVARNRVSASAADGEKLMYYNYYIQNNQIYFKIKTNTIESFLEPQQ